MINEDVKIKIDPAVAASVDSSAPPAAEVEPGIKLTVDSTPDIIKLKIKEPIEITLKLKRALNNDFMVYDHPHYDVVIMPSKNKISTFPKSDLRFDSYTSQDKLFRFLASKGLITRDTVSTGMAFNSLEAVYPINNDVKTVQAILYALYNYFKDEVASLKRAEDFIEMTDEDFYDPDDDSTTELGEIPHEERKGSIDPNYRPLGLMYRL